MKVYDLTTDRLSTSEDILLDYWSTIKLTSDDTWLDYWSIIKLTNEDTWLDYSSTTIN